MSIPFAGIGRLFSHFTLDFLSWENSSIAKMRSQFLAAVATIPLASAQLNKLAQDAGKLYFGTATDNGELNNTQYVSILSNTSEFGQLTPSNGQKVSY